MTKWIKQNAAALLVLAAGIVFLAVGVMRREQMTILEKAIRVCLECIGIG